MNNNHCYGYKLITDKYITTHDITTLCELLNEKFKGTPYTFLPEPITEGGIVFKGLESGYKSLRFHSSHMNKSVSNKLLMKHKCKTPVCERWPWINDPKQAIDEWNFVEAKNLFPEDQVIVTVLRSSGGAPSWTLEELKIFEECFLEIGMKRKGKYPSKKRLLM